MPVVRVYRLGDAPPFQSYADWLAWVQSVGGAAVTLPSNVPASLLPYAGQPAARYDNATYTSLFNAGNIDLGAPQVASASGAFVYVVAPQNVWAGAPQLMTAAQALENKIFNGADNLANDLHLPTLKDTEDWLKGIGKEVAIGVAVAVGVALVLKRLTR